jgi:hypothetical protein
MGFTVLVGRSGGGTIRYDLIAPTENDAINQAGNLYAQTHPDWDMFGSDVSFRIERNA